MRSTLTVPLLLLLAGNAVAADGVLEINQVCALQTGCFAGDTPGFPVTITAGGSYRLTSNLGVPDANTDGIAVSTSDVGIDLNNFAIVGPVTCSGTPLSCAPGSGTGRGVAQTLPSNRAISVKNGSITGMGTHGVLLGDQAEVTNLRVRWCRFIGINTGPGSTIQANTVYQNGTGGISANAGSTVKSNTTYQNGGGGIFTNSGATVSENTSYQNGTFGIIAGSGATVEGNTVYNNLSDGIVAGSGASVKGNTVRLNTGWGLNLGSQTTYLENTITGNGAGTVVGSGPVNMGANSCNGTATCP